MKRESDGKRFERELWEGLAFSAEELEALGKVAFKCGHKGRGKAREFVGLFILRQYGWKGDTPFPSAYLEGARNAALDEVNRIEEAAARVKARSVEERIAGLLLGDVMESGELWGRAVLALARRGVRVQTLCRRAVWRLSGCQGGIEVKRRLLARWLGVPDYVMSDALRGFEFAVEEALRGSFRPRIRVPKIQPWMQG